MLFNSYPFLLVFLPLVLMGYASLSGYPRLRLQFLTLVSYVFYAYWNYKFIPLLLLSTSIDFFLAKKMYQQSNQLAKKKYLLASVILNLSLLGFFKYYYFTMNTVSSIFEIFGAQISLPGWEIVLPVGISFYTFQSLSYTIDVYRNSNKPYDDFTAFCCYVAFFPQLIAGPIIRHDWLVPQIIESVKHSTKSRFYIYGIRFFILGLSKKIIIADRLAAAVDPMLMQLHHLSSLEAWLCALGYTLQLYFDFSGYSDMAIGLGFLFGMQFPQNFNSPYQSVSITDFWRRWHMTLSSWLRDYLYISLGGNRQGRLRTYVNLFLTMLLGGLWHGAGWNYVIWGAYHGALLGVERAGKSSPIRIPKSLSRIVTFILVVIGWVFFRSEDLSMCWLWLQKMFFLADGFSLLNMSPGVKDRFLAILVISLGIVFKSKNTYIDFEKINFKWRHALAYAFLFVVCLLYLAKASPFLYFQF